MARAWARGWRVCVIQCVKSGDWHTGEHKLAEHLGIEWHAMGDGFTWDSDDLGETARLGREAWEAARTKLASGDFDLPIKIRCFLIGNNHKPMSLPFTKCGLNDMKKTGKTHNSLMMSFTKLS